MLASLPVYQIKHHIQTLSLLLEALRLVIDDDVCAETAGELHIVGRDCGEHPGPLRLCKLDGKVANATRTAMNQHRPSTLQLAIPK